MAVQVTENLPPFHTEELGGEMAVYGELNNTGIILLKLQRGENKAPEEVLTSK